MFIYAVVVTVLNVIGKMRQFILIMMRIAASRCIQVSPLCSALRAPFSSDKGKGPRIQTVGFTSKNIQNIKNLSYKLNQSINYEDGRFLIFRSKFSWLRTLKDYFVYLALLGWLGYLLYNRVNFNIYPIIKHVYVLSSGFVLFLMARKFMKNHNIVKEIYLLQGGKATQIIFMNQFKRKLFGEIQTKTYYNSLFVHPKGDEILNLNLFPLEKSQIKESSHFFSYWKKYYSNDNNLLLIPKDYEYMHEEIMVEVMNGKLIYF